MKRIYTLVLCIFCLLINAQEQCGTDSYTLKLMQKYPKLIEKYQQDNIKNLRSNISKRKTNGVITIPVVVHIVWKTSIENISDEQILSQIDVLNEDFRRTNIDVINTPSHWQNIAADTEIEFCLAETDPNGNTTTGITRTQTSVTAFSMTSNNVKFSSTGGVDAWNNNNYLNIWVCNLSGGILGYATTPFSSWAPPEDGVVIDYDNFGRTGEVIEPYHRGRTTTHEIGHWLNLEHLWGAAGICGDDFVSDTPKQEKENFFCPFPAIVNPNSCGTTNANGDMYMNYMDYTNDACMNLFTKAQKNRMISAIEEYRPILLHNTCNDPYTHISEISSKNKKIIRIIDMLGRPINKHKKNTPLLYIYDDGTVEKKTTID